MVLNKKIFVTGGTGTIGKVLVPLLVKSGYKVTILSRFREHKNTIINKNINFVIGNINNHLLMEKLIKDNDYLIHMAATINPDSLKENFYNVNFHDSIRLLSLANKYNYKKIIYISTIAIFADTGIEARTEKWKYKSDKNRDYYSDSKIKCLEWIHNNLTSCITIFPSLVINISDLSEYKSPSGLIGLIYRLFGQNIPGGLMGRIGPGNRIINYIDVHDLGTGIILALRNSKINQEYLLTGFNLTVDEYLLKMAKKLNIKYNYRRLEGLGLKIFKSLARMLPNNQISTLIRNVTFGHCCFYNIKAKIDLGFKPIIKL